MNPDLTTLINMNLNLFSDEASRLIYLSQVYYALTGDYAHIGRMLKSLWEDYREAITSDEFRKVLSECQSELTKLQPLPRFAVDNGTMFFDPAIVTLRKDEVFCDCGALEMATSLEFVYRVENEFRKIYAFEPDPVCQEMCRDNLQMFDRSVRERISLYDFGLDEIDGNRPFARSTVLGNSRIVEKSDEIIHVRRLDGLTECGNITFLKIHTEGNEFSVLKGAAELVRRNKPLIAVSLYHNAKELINAPLLLHGLVPEYRFFMRHYSTGTSESVLYAVGKERLDETQI